VAGELGTVVAMVGEHGLRELAAAGDVLGDAGLGLAAVQAQGGGSYGRLSDVFWRGPGKRIT
jgi:hypothetical protein